MTKERLQLNVRFDGKAELLKAAKKRARQLGLTFTDFVADALTKALHDAPPATHDSQPPTSYQLHDLKEQINRVRISLMTELRKRDEQLAQHQELIGELAGAIARLEHRLDAEPSPPTTSQPRKASPKKRVKPKPITAEPPAPAMSSWQEWEEICTDMIDDIYLRPEDFYRG